MKTSSTSSFKRIPIAFLLALAIILPIEAFQSRYDYYFYRNSSNIFFDPVDATAGLPPLQMKVKNDDAWRGRNAYDVAIIGDSSAVVGFRPELVASITGLSAYNYATFLTDGVRAPYYVLNNVLNRSEHPPRYVVLCVTFLYFSVKLDRPGMEYTYIRGNGLNILHDLGFGPFMKAQVPTLHHQVYLKNFLAAPSWPRKSDFDDLRGQINLMRAAGGRLEFYPDAVYEATEPFTMHDYTPHVPRVGQTVELIARRTQEAGSTLIVMLAPAPPVQLEYMKQFDKWPETQTFLKTLAQTYPHVRLLDVQDQFMDNRWFVDMHHTNRIGIDKLSTAVADFIRKDMAATASR